MTEQTEQTKAPGIHGRPPSPVTEAKRAKILELANTPEGVANIELAKLLGVTTAYSQAIARPLVIAGQLDMFKDADNGRVYYKTAGNGDLVQSAEEEEEEEEESEDE